MQKIGYARVSTDEQSLDLQCDALKQAGCTRIFEDHGVSGIQSQRSGLDEALTALCSGDVLMVWKLDRLGRSLRLLIDLIESLEKRGVGFQSLSDGISTTTPGGELVFHILGAIAQFERSLISERTRAGMHAAKRNGKHIGRPPKLTEDQIIHAYASIRDGHTITATAASLGCSRITLSQTLQRMGFET